MSGELKTGIFLVGLGMKTWTQHVPRTDGHVVAIGPDGSMFKAFNMNACRLLFGRRQDELSMAQSYLNLSRAETRALMASEGHVTVDVATAEALYDALHIKLLPSSLTDYIRDRFEKGFTHVDKLIAKHLPHATREELLQLANYLAGEDGCCVPASYVYTLAVPFATLRAARLGFVVPPDTVCTDWEYEAATMITEAVAFRKGAGSAKAPFSHLVA